MGKKLVTSRAITEVFHIHGDNDALRPKSIGSFLHKLGIKDGCGVYADLVGTGVKQGSNITDSAHPTANGEGNKHLGRYLFDSAIGGISLLVACCYVEEGDLVGTSVIVATRDLNGVACVTNANEIDALNYASLVNIQAGNDSLRERHQPRVIRSESA